MNITNFKIRASYPNFFMLNLYMEQNRFIFEKENEREGNKPGTVIFQLENDDNLYEIAPKWYDIYYLLTKNNDKEIFGAPACNRHDLLAGCDPGIGGGFGCCLLEWHGLYHLASGH